MQDRLTRLVRRAVPLLLVGMAVWTYLTYGFQREVARDDALFAYSGQRVADGCAPYERSFDAKGPLSYAVPALGVLAARQLHIPEYRGVQGEFVVISILCVLAVYLLTREVTGSVVAGVFAAIMFLGFEGFLQHAAGARAKTTIVLLTPLALLALVRRRWALGGALVAAAALTWQTMVLLGLAAIPSILREEPSRRLRAFVALLAGGLAVVALVVAWFAAEGALTDLWHGAVVSLTYLASRTSELPLSWRFWRPVRRCWEGYPSTFMAGCFGVLGLIAAFAEKSREEGGAIGALTRSPWSVIFLGFIMLVGFSILDFQIYGDAYPLLPFIALGLGFVLERALTALTGPESLIRPGQRPLAAALVALALFSPTVVFVKFHPGRGLAEQQRISREIADRLGDGTIQCINAPQILCLAELKNATRYAILSGRLLGFVEDHEPGGVDGLLRSMGRADLVVCYVSDCEQMPCVYDRVKRNYRLWRTYEKWEVYERPRAAENVPVSP